MTKLIKMTLVSAVLATGAMAGEYTYLPKVIEAGATVNLNQDITCYTSIDNYGTIQSTNGTVTISGSGTLINHDGQELNELTTGIPEGNAIEGVTKAYGLTVGTASFDSENIGNGATFTITNTSETGCDFSGRGETDLVYLGSDSANQKVSIAGGSGDKTAIACHFGDQSAAQSYGLELSGNLDFTGTFSKYTGGKIEVPSSAAGVRIDFNNTEFNVPVTVADQGQTSFFYLTDVTINKDFTVGDDTFLNFLGDSKLSNGATLTIGTKAEAGVEDGEFNE